jgi:hypothetical protein
MAFQKSSLNNPGILALGNIDLYNRPIAHNPDGSISTVRSISANFGNGEVLLPTVINGKVVSPEEAIAYYKKTGQNLGTFDTPENSDIYAERLHNQQAEHYSKSALTKLLGQLL